MQSQLYTSKLSRLWRLMKLGPKVLRFKMRGDKIGLYSCICEEFLQLGGVYVKFLQGVLLQSDVMKNWAGSNKYKVFEAVPTVEIDVIAMLTAELKRPVDEVFASVETQPFATGSFGQVYQAQLKNSQAVIIKILRPHIRQILKFDLRLLGFIAKLFSADFTSFDVSLSRAIRDFKVMTLREVDYKSEAQFAQEMDRVFANNPMIYIPKTYQALCTSQLIVQDYVAGVSVAEVLKKVQTEGRSAEAVTQELVGSDIKQQLSSLATAVLYNFFVYPRMPGDLHPGNIKLLPNNRVGIIDFGISARQPRTPNVFYTLLKQLATVREDGKTAGQMFVTYIKYYSYDLYLSFDRVGRALNSEQNMLEFITRYAQGLFDKQTNSQFKLSDIKYSTMFGAYVNQVVNANNRFCVVTKVTEVELLRAVQTLVALIDSLGLRVLIGDIFQTVYEQVTKTLPQYTREPTNPLTLHEAMATIDSWLGRLALKNPELFLQIKSFLHRQKQLQNN